LQIAPITATRKQVAVVPSTHLTTIPSGGPLTGGCSPQAVGPPRRDERPMNAVRPPRQPTAGTRPRRGFTDVDVVQRRSYAFAHAPGGSDRPLISLGRWMTAGRSTRRDISRCLTAHIRPSCQNDGRKQGHGRSDAADVGNLPSMTTTFLHAQTGLPGCFWNRGCHF
jgi:hypothetical protein